MWKVIGFYRHSRVDLLERAKKEIVDFQAARKRQPLNIEESAGPFRYEYVSVSHVLGAKLPDGSPDPLQIAHFPDVNATAYLTHDWDEQYFHIDRANSVATLLLTGLVGIKRFKKLSRYVNRLLQWVLGPERVFMRNLETQAARIREQRRKDHSGSGCCLVYRARGQVAQPLNLSASRRFAEVGVALDAFDGSVIREEHKLNVRSTATAVSIAMTDTNGSPEIRFLADNIHLLSKDEIVIYARTLKMGAAGIVVTTMSSDEFVAAIETYSAGLSADSKLSSAASLFALSQQKSNDNLRSFIACWTAFELLIFNLEKKYREVFQGLLWSDDVVLPTWDKDLKITDIGDYRLRDRFYAVACSINLSEAEGDTKKFNELNSKRNDYYHRFKIADTELPTYDVQSLFRKYLKIVLSAS
jgi:hypothetical protein